MDWRLYVEDDAIIMMIWGVLNATNHHLRILIIDSDNTSHGLEIMSTQDDALMMKIRSCKCYQSRVPNPNQTTHSSNRILTHFYYLHEKKKNTIYINYF